MKCPYCDSASRVTNSRSHNNGHGVWRRRLCVSCSAIWTTNEIYDLATTHRISEDISPGALTAFSRDVLFQSIKDAVSHRKTALADASELTDTVISKVLSCKTADVPLSLLTQMVDETLQAFDPTAAAVYRAKHAAWH